jgi:hypothetical protein
VLLTTVLKDTAKAQKELEEVEKERDKIQQEREELQASNQEFRKTIDELKRKLERSQQETAFPPALIPQAPSPPPSSPSVPLPPQPMFSEVAPSILSPQTSQRSRQMPSLSLSIVVAALVGLFSVLFTRQQPFIFQDGSSTPAEQSHPEFWQPILVVAVLGGAIALFLFLRQNRWFKEFLKGI